MSQNFEIETVHGRQVWDSRGRPTVEVDVRLASGVSGRAIAPAGASRGDNEAVDLRDGGAFCGGLGVDKAVANVNALIADALTGRDVRDQDGIDQVLIDLDGTPNKARLGGNATTATSMAVLHAAAAAEGVPLWQMLSDGKEVSLPMPEIQIFGGGAHASRRVDIQDFMIMVPNVEKVSDAFRVTAEVYHAAGRLLDEQGRLQGTAEEGGWWPAFDSNREGLDLLVQAIERAGFVPGEDVWISLDIAASEFEKNGEYILSKDNATFNSEEWMAEVLDWTRSYPLASIEDPLSERDTEGMIAITQEVGSQVQIVGDDYLVTSADRVASSLEEGACNAILVKVNQAGTISEAKRACEASRAAGWGTIVSARSGETEDLTIVHLAVGWNARQFKVGSFSRSERMAKWNELIRIEETLGAKAHYAGAEGLIASSPAWPGAK